MAEPLRYPGMPRWVKVSGIVVSVVALLVLVIMLTGIGGPHGPGRHLSSGAASGQPPPSIVDGSGMQQP